jgi:formylglycine-generating enzyme required for sulfatase activity
MLTGGERPFTGEQATVEGSTGTKVRWEQLNIEPPSPTKWNPNVTSEMEAVVLRCLAKEPEARFASIPDLLGGLEEVIGDRSADQAMEGVEPAIERTAATTDDARPERHRSEPAQEGSANVGKRIRELARLLAGRWGIAAVIAVVGIVALVLALGTRGPDDDSSVTQMSSPQETEQTTVISTNSNLLPPEPGDTQTATVDGMEMVFIPAGSFTMGSTQQTISEAIQNCRIYSDNCQTDFFEDQFPPHDVNLDSYWIDQTEVTNAMFAAFLNDQGNRAQGGTTWLDASGSRTRIHQEGDEWVVDSGYESHPVTQVSWYGAQAYCQWAGRRLPTEAEWEQAARGVDGRRYPWGNSQPTCQVTNFDECTSDTSPVGAYPQGASPYGVQDLSGNVWEWVADWYGAEYYANSPPNNPQGPVSSDGRVMRGGSWGTSPAFFEATYRVTNTPEDSDNFSGFRCAVSHSDLGQTVSSTQAIIPDGSETQTPGGSQVDIIPFGEDQVISASDEVKFAFCWTAATSAYANEYADRVRLHIQLDGEELTIPDDAWGPLEVTEDVDGDGVEDYARCFDLYVGRLEPGVHEVYMTTEIPGGMTDGFDLDGDDQLDWYESYEGSMYLTVE